MRERLSVRTAIETEELQVPEPTPLETFVHRYQPGRAAVLADPAGKGGVEVTPQLPPTLLLLHGTGGDENDLVPIGRMLRPDAALLSLRGRVLENGMPRFFRRISAGVSDLEDLRVRVEELAAFLDAAVEKYVIDRRRMFVVGFSNGANFASSLLFTRPGALAGAALFRPRVPFEPDPLPDLSRVPVFIAAGRSDPVVSREQSEQLTTFFRAAGAHVVLDWRDAGHALTPGEIERAREWMKGR